MIVSLLQTTVEEWRVHTRLADPVGDEPGVGGERKGQWRDERELEVHDE